MLRRIPRFPARDRCRASGLQAVKLRAFSATHFALLQCVAEPDLSCTTGEGIRVHGSRVVLEVDLTDLTALSAEAFDALVKVR